MRKYEVKLIEINLLATNGSNGFPKGKIERKKFHLTPSAVCFYVRSQIKLTLSAQ